MSLISDPLSVIDGLDEFLSDRQPPGIPELRQGLREVLGGESGADHLLGQELLGSGCRLEVLGEPSAAAAHLERPGL